jgi:hypothetical protein
MTVAGFDECQVTGDQEKYRSHQIWSPDGQVLLIP